MKYKKWNIYITQAFSSSVHSYNWNYVFRLTSEGLTELFGHSDVMWREANLLCQLRVAVENRSKWQVLAGRLCSSSVIRLAAAATRLNILVQKSLSSRRTIFSPNFHIHCCIWATHKSHEQKKSISRLGQKKPVSRFWRFKRRRRSRSCWRCCQDTKCSSPEKTLELASHSCQHWQHWKGYSPSTESSSLAQ